MYVLHYNYLRIYVRTYVCEATYKQNSDTYTQYICVLLLLLQHEHYTSLWKHIILQNILHMSFIMRSTLHCFELTIMNTITYVSVSLVVMCNMYVLIYQNIAIFIAIRYSYVKFFDYVLQFQQCTQLFSWFIDCFSLLFNNAMD